MASVGPSSDRIAVELLQNLTLDSDNLRAQQVHESARKTSSSNNAPACLGAITNGQSNLLDRLPLPSHWDSTVPSTCSNHKGHPLSTYNHGDYNVSTPSERDKFVIPDVAEMPHTMYGGCHRGYNCVPYGMHSPSCSNTECDSQRYACQQYPCPTTHVQPSSSRNGTHSWNQPNDVQSEVTTLVSSQSLLPGNQSHNFIDMISRSNTSTPIRPSSQNTPLKPTDTYGWGDISEAHHWMSLPGTHSSNFHSETSQNMQHPPHLMGFQRQMEPSELGVGYMNQMLYGQHGNGFRRDFGFRPGTNGVRLGSHDWIPTHKSLGWSTSLSSELNRGPRTKLSKDQDSEPTILSVKEHTLHNFPLFLRREQFNHDDFPETFTNAKFFVIKSYSEDDVHKSVKYSVWSSTPNGNKKLDEAFKEAQQKPGGCPVFLLFSVNASGQFVGLAEMVGPVDYDKTVEYWQQDKWNGCFPVKWHMVKDVPNSLLRHITLQNNENKPVTNSRDTQEVGLEQGIQILKIFKGHSGKTCILDDLEFYEGRQRIMQEMKAKHHVSSNRQEGVGEGRKGRGRVLDGKVKGKEERRSFAEVVISHDKLH